MTRRPLHIPLTEGLPDAGAPGQWLGRDAHGAVYLLRWHEAQGCWGALGFASDTLRPWAHIVFLRGRHAGHIVGHVEGPPLSVTRTHSDRPTIITAAEIRGAPPPPPDRGISLGYVEDAAPLWPGLLWPFLPALGGLAILAVVSAWSMS
jgi:hypothetical protein